MLAVRGGVTTTKKSDEPTSCPHRQVHVARHSTHSSQERSHSFGSCLLKLHRGARCCHNARLQARAGAQRQKALSSSRAGASANELQRQMKRLWFSMTTWVPISMRGKQVGGNGLSQNKSEPFSVSEIAAAYPQHHVSTSFRLRGELEGANYSLEVIVIQPQAESRSHGLYYMIVTARVYESP